MNGALFSFDQVAVAHRGRTLLRNVSLRLEHGETLAIVGPNGAGKSSLLMALMGFRKIASGSAEFLSRDISQLSNREWTKVRKRVGYLPQQLPIDPLFPITAEEVILLGRVGYTGFPRPLGEKDRSIAASWIETFGLNDLRHRPFGQLSGGEQQKVHLARLMTQDPEILLLDEPTSALDLKWQQAVGTLIEEIAVERKIGIVLVTHEAHQIPPSCQRVALLRAGMVFKAGPKEEVLTESVLSQVYECRVKPVSHSQRVYLLPWGHDD
jgi:ABC-type cobalamin/Fe3+-siderophores transport system ATPase subunit